MDFQSLEKQGKTVIYMESESNDNFDGWDFWGESVVDNVVSYVYRKIVSFKEAEQYENELLD